MQGVCFAAVVKTVVGWSIAGVLRPSIRPDRRKESECRHAIRGDVSVRGPRRQGRCGERAVFHVDSRGVGAVIRAMDFLSNDNSASCWGIGFVAMDVIDVEGDRFAAVGGSCGNVMAILAWLGWTAKPIARLGGDAVGDFIREELRGLGMDVASLTEETELRSPIVLQRFSTARDGTRTHRFSLTCPGCGRWLPRHRSVTLSQSKSLRCGGEAPNVLYFDRVSPASLRLAAIARRRGTLVVFEPSSADAEAKFQSAVDTCHVLKYSQERLGHLPDLPYAASPALIIETRGDAGLRYRWKGRWSQLDAFPVEDIVDAAGSGDWCTATLLHRMGRTGAGPFTRSTRSMIEAALQDGQAAAAVNCGFLGARGAMQALTLAELNERLLTFGHDTPRRNSPEYADSPKLSDSPLHYCDQCNAQVREGSWTVKKTG